MSRATLLEEIRQGEIETVVTAFPDMYGRLVGKRISGSFFADETAKHGMHVCNYLLACDMEMDPVPGYALTSWETGYGDFLCVPDWATLRRASWLEKSAVVICDVLEDSSSQPVAVAPRAILRCQVERARAAGYVPLGASELEFFVFRNSFSEARELRYEGLETFGGYIEDYHILQGTRIEPLVGAIRRHLESSGIPVEFSKGEWGAGQQEINLRYCELLEMADRHVLYKNAAKEIADAQGVALTFMAKWAAEHAGNSMHVHTSLWDAPDALANAFAGEEPLPGTPVRSAPLFRHWLAGLLTHARELTLFFAPYVNSYKRFAKGTFAPTAIAWAYDNRTTGFRVVGRDRSLRVECRIPGADANPYLVFAAMIAAGLDGVERKLPLEDALVGNAYASTDVPQLPRSLGEAIEATAASELLRAAFGSDVLDHYLHFARTEKRKFDETVTTWERARFLERA
ncbi:MAG: glutamine synthetase family protein [Myxococcota bacterium]